MNIYKRKPDWLKVKLPDAKEYSYIKDLLKTHKLNTICESGNCPNMGECWAAKTATFMILGDVCTRACRFCNVTTGKPSEADKAEPINIAKAVQTLKLKHCVITSVTRDDLPDGGAAIWSDTIKAIQLLNPETTIETLIPDFKGNTQHLQQVIDAKPDIISHNLETVRRLTKELRIYASYDTSLSVIRYISDSGIISKSGIMLGIGETYEEVIQTMQDAVDAGCKIFTIGQYLQPTRENIAVTEYIKPEVFETYKQQGLKLGLKYIESSPLARSSFHSAEHLDFLMKTLK